MKTIIIWSTVADAVCARCGLSMGFPDNGGIHYCLNEYTCE